MHLTRLRRLSRIATLVAMLAYALPSSVALVAAIGHGGEHLVDLARHQHRRAAVLGLSHTAPATPMTSAEDPVQSGGWVHTHGGSSHRHEGVVGRLVQASPLDADELRHEAAPQTLTIHLPATSSPRDVGSTLCSPRVFGHALPCSASEGEPRLPPPRV